MGRKGRGGGTAGGTRTAASAKGPTFTRVVPKFLKGLIPEPSEDPVGTDLPETTVGDIERTHREPNLRRTEDKQDIISEEPTRKRQRTEPMSQDDYEFELRQLREDGFTIDAHVEDGSMGTSTIPQSNGEETSSKHSTKSKEPGNGDSANKGTDDKSTDVTSTVAAAAAKNTSRESVVDVGYKSTPRSAFTSQKRHNASKRPAEPKRNTAALSFAQDSDDSDDT